MKYAESQERLYELDIPSEFAEGAMNTSYQNILDIILRQAMRMSKTIWGEDFGLPAGLDQDQRDTALENLFQGFVQL
jgi:hypothetical protein